MRYVRFVIQDTVDADTHQPTGVFQAAYDLLRDSTALSTQHRTELRSALDWFNAHLHAPGRVSRSRKANAAPNAISWMKLDAAEHIGRLRALCDIVAAYHTVFEVCTDRPGYITHDDAHQVIAEPFTDTLQRGIWKQYTSPPQTSADQ